MGVLSNIDVYWAIAEEAHANMQTAWAEHVTPKPDGQPGYIIRWDPDRSSFKSAMIAIAFCGMFLDSLLYLSLQDRLGRVKALRVDRLPHEKRLEALGIIDSVLLDRMVAFRESRKDLVHEKAVELTDLTGQSIRTAQDTADSAMSLMQDIRVLLVAP